MMEQTPLELLAPSASAAVAGAGNLPGAPKIGRLAVRGAASYNAAAHIFREGPKAPSELFAVVDFGHKASHQEDKLHRALKTGWLVERADGKIDCGTVARAHFAYEAGGDQDKPIGQLAATRQPVNVLTRPPLSKKYMPNPRGMRRDIPEWSVREKASFKSVGGGAA